MLRVRISHPAESDLGGIIDYLAERNPSAAQKFIGQFLERCDLLALNPLLGETCQSTMGEWRMISLQSSYIIFYSVEPDRIEIARVIHGARDWQAMVMPP
jgi:toxin ParE1/3/4